MDSKAILRQKINDLQSVGVISDRTHVSLMEGLDSAMTEQDWIRMCQRCLNAVSEGADHGFYFGLCSKPDE